MRPPVLAHQFMQFERMGERMTTAPGAQPAIHTVRGDADGRWGFGVVAGRLGIETAIHPLGWIGGAGESRRMPRRRPYRA